MPAGAGPKPGMAEQCCVPEQLVPAVLHSWLHVLLMHAYPGVHGWLMASQLVALGEIVGVVPKAMHAICCCPVAPTGVHT